MAKSIPLDAELLTIAVLISQMDARAVKCIRLLATNDDNWAQRSISDPKVAALYLRLSLNTRLRKLLDDRQWT
jgi:hypothetical protein